MSAKGDSAIEITRDILVAILSNPNSSLGAGAAEAMAKNVATAFGVIYDAVKAKEMAPWKGL